jgi:nucleolar protein 56
MSLYFLYESAAGYALFEKVEFDEASTTLKQVQSSIESFEQFSKMVKLKSFMGFQGAEKALSNLKALAASEVSEDLSNFLEAAVSKAKSSKVYLAVLDKVLATKITEQFGIQIRVSDAIFEVFRGLRLHFTKFMKKKSTKIQKNV